MPIIFIHEDPSPQTILCCENYHTQQVCLLSFCWMFLQKLSLQLTSNLFSMVNIETLLNRVFDNELVNSSIKFSEYEILAATSGKMFMNF